MTEYIGDISTQRGREDFSKKTMGKIFNAIIGIKNSCCEGSSGSHIREYGAQNHRNTDFAINKDIITLFTSKGKSHTIFLMQGDTRCGFMHQTA
ncbi:MAG: hypothetical protein ABSE07_07740 [Methanoregula sp.]